MDCNVLDHHLEVEREQRDLAPALGLSRRARRRVGRVARIDHRVAGRAARVVPQGGGAVGYISPLLSISIVADPGVRADRFVSFRSDRRETT